MIDYEAINKRLYRRFGDEVKLVPCEWSDEFPYCLRFENEDVSEDDLETAVNIVNSFTPSN